MTTPSRIQNLPRRDWRATAELNARLCTELLRTPHGTMSLRPIQGAALVEAAECGGLFAQIRVGGGKTLLSGLLPRVLGSRRPLLLVPSNLCNAKNNKTGRELEELRLHWQIPKTIRVEGYSRLGRCDEVEWDDADGVTHTSSSADIIKNYAPDLIIADEAHRLSNIKTAAVARRVAQYLALNPHCRFCALSGSPTKDSVLNYFHLVQWALRERAPIPLEPLEWDTWAAAMDSCVPEEDRPDVRTFERDFGQSVSDVRSLRAAFANRFESTPGIIVSSDTYKGSTLRIEPIVLNTPDVMEPHFVRLRAECIAPDDYPLGDARFQVWSTARQMALGFCYVMDPRPPKPWLEARRAWCRYVRYILEHTTTMDSELQVRQACQRGDLKCDAWYAWDEIRDTFKPNTVPMWFSDHALEACERWATTVQNQGQGGVVWTDHYEFARKLAKRTKWSYFGEGGLNGAGLGIEAAPAGDIIVASMKANFTGRNLQYQYANSLITCPWHNGRDWEQLLGRMFREGQEQKVVTYRYFVSCIESVDALQKAVMDAKFIEETQKQPQLLLHSEFKPARAGKGSAYVRTITTGD